MHFQSHVQWAWFKLQVKFSYGAPPLIIKKNFVDLNIGGFCKFNFFAFKKLFA